MPPKAAPAKPKYKLTYFNVRARGELSRLLLNQAGQDFVDIRIEQEEWPALKKDTPSGTLPVLEFGGNRYSQSMAIARFLASELGLNGKNNVERLAVDECLCDIVDLMTKVFAPLFEQDDAKKADLTKELENTIIPNYVKRLESKIGKSGWIVGDAISAADIANFDVLDGIMNRGNTKCLDKTPKVKALLDKVKTQPKIKAYLAKRPASTL